MLKCWGGLNAVGTKRRRDLGVAVDMKLGHLLLFSKRLGREYRIR